MKYYFLITLFILSHAQHLYCQDKDLVTHEGINSPLHQSNKGRIFFISDVEPLEGATQADFLNSIELKSKADLNLLAYMDNSLTNYLHRLAPEMSQEKLVQNGNYQFSFYVDDRLVYVENLHPGAGWARTKNTKTILAVPLLSTQNDHIWSRFMWNRFIASGGDTALAEGKHFLKIEIRPYVNKPEPVVGELIATGQLELTVKKPVIDVSKVKLNEIEADSGWPVSKEIYDRNKIKELKASIEEDIFIDITSLVVVKEGKLLIEEYFNGAGRNTLHDPRSVGKSFASTVAGIALKEGYLKSEAQTLKEFYDLGLFAHFSPRKEKISVRDLLTMSSAFEGDDGISLSAGNEEYMYPTDNWVKFTLDLPVDTVKKPGEWHYFTAGVVLLGDILDKSVPGGLEKYAAEKLFSPLGIQQYQWEYTPQKVANTAGGIRMRSLDFAKWGQLYQNQGQWHGKQILPKDWVTKTFTRHKVIPGRTGDFYGYLFWNKTYQVNGRSYETYYATGNGGNKVMIFKDLPLVIVITATAYNAPYSHLQVDKMMEQYILPALVKENHP